MTKKNPCPRCGGTAFREVDCGPDSFEDDVSYTSRICEKCGLYESGWTDKWLVDCESWIDEDGAEEFHSLDDLIAVSIKQLEAQKKAKKQFCEFTKGTRWSKLMEKIGCPANIEFLLWCHTTGEPHPRLDAPSIRECFHEFIEIGAIEEFPDRLNCYRTTPLGRAWVAALCNTPPPVPVFVDAAGNVLLT